MQAWLDKFHQQQKQIASCIKTSTDQFLMVIAKRQGAYSSKLQKYQHDGLHARRDAAEAERPRWIDVSGWSVVRYTDTDGTIGQNCQETLRFLGARSRIRAI